jgi:NhaA family Na+:H+ antiporter
VALILANSGVATTFIGFWQTQLSINLSHFSLSMDIRHWINEGLMTFFFLVVGLEIKREIIKGELRHAKTALLPILSAVGGMVVPAVIYIVFNASSAHGIQGWAIPIATDIALAVSVLAFVGKGLPSSLRLFLLTLAIVDDIGAIVVVAVFLGVGLNVIPLIVIVAISIALIVFRKKKWLTPFVFAVAGIILWLAVKESGVEASIAGAILGLLAPVINHSGGENSLVERVEKVMIPISTLFVVPIFVLANAGVALSGIAVTGATFTIGFGVIFGLVLGKVIGIVGTSILLVKLRIANLPDNTSWEQLIGIGFIAGIGFTVSLFVSDLSFQGNTALSDFAKISVIIASIVSAGIGLFILKNATKLRT